MARLFMVIFLAVFLVTPFAKAQKAKATVAHQANAAAPVDPLAIIQQSLSAMGITVSPGFGTISQGTMTDSTGTSTQFTLKTLGLDKVRHDLGSDFTSVVNGGNGFVIANGTRSTLPNWATRFRRAEHLPSLSLMANNLDPDLQVQYVGLENVNGQPAYHLRLSMLLTDGTPANLADLMSEFHVYIDSVSMLVLKTRTFDFSPISPQNRTPVSTFYSDYRQQGGALVPFHLVSYLVNQKYSDVTFTSISLNASVSESDFQ